MRYDVRIMLDGSKPKGGKRKSRPSADKELRQTNRALQREVLELRAEVAVIKRIAIYAINVRNPQTDRENGKQNSKEPCG
jgi:hypothetical protein